MSHPARLCFDSFAIELDNERLLRDGEPVALTPKAFALLALLVQRPGRLVLKDELLDTVWGRRFVSEGTIKSLLAELRAAMGDDARAPRWVETVPRRGLRFIGALQPAPGAVQAAPDLRAAPMASSLPIAPSPPVAREAELAQLTTLLQAHRLVTLIGPAGVGKTRLALAVATAWQAREPVWWIELAPLAAADADAATLRAMLVSALRLAGGAAASDEALAAALPALHGLLLLDNAEHLLDTLAPLAARLQRHAPRLRWLLTSREPLKVADEQVLRLAPMPVPQPADDADLQRVLASGAVQLFAARVAARLPGFVINEAQAAPAARVCRALDGLPLALEMAAARVPVLGVGGLDEHLGGPADDGADAGGAGSRLALLTQGLRDLAPHQRTLRGSLAWSHALLNGEEQRVFRRLAVFRGGFTPASAAGVCAFRPLPAGAAEGSAATPGAAVLDALHALEEKSLLGSSAGADGLPRLGMLESVREFAVEQLQAAGETQAASRAHLAAMGEYWRRADDEALDVPAMAWLDRHAPELDNLRAALRWAQRAATAGADADRSTVAVELLALIGHAHLLWTRQGLAREGRHWCEVAGEVAASMAAPDAVPEGVLANIDLLRADLAFIYRVLPIVDGVAAAERAAEALARSGDARHEFHARSLAASLLTEAGRAAGGDRHVERMRALVQPGWGELRLRLLRIADASAARRRGDLARYRAIARQEWALCRRLQAAGESWTAAHLVCVAEGLHGDFDEALAVTSQAVAEVCAAGRQQQYGQLLSMHAMLTAVHRPTDEARAVLALTLPLLPQMGAAEVQWLALGWLAWREGRPDDAALVLGWFESPSHGAASRFGDETLVGQTRLRLLAQVEAALGPERAGACRRRGHDLGHEQALAAALGPAAAA